MLGCSLAGIEQEEVLQGTTSQPLEGALTSNVSLGSASGLAEASEPMYLSKDDEVRPCPCPLIKIPVLFDACPRRQKRRPRKSTVPSGDTHLTPITAKERKNLDEYIKKKYNRFRRRYPEIHGKVVDFRPTIRSCTGRCGRHFGVGQKIAHRNARIVLFGEVVSHAL